MCVEDHRSRRAGRADFAENHGFAPGTDTSLGVTPRFSSIFAMNSALRWILARSVAMLGIERRAMNSSTMARSCRSRHWRAAMGGGVFLRESSRGYEEDA